MKNVILGFLILLFAVSCSDTDRLNELEKRITNIEKQNKVLVDSLNTVDSDFIKPFKIYEKIVLSEFKRSPDEVISDYELLMKNYPNSFWRHEAKKRIENIEKRKKYWSKKNGWKLPEKSKIIEVVESISCPGC